MPIEIVRGVRLFEEGLWRWVQPGPWASCPAEKKAKLIAQAADEVIEGKIG